MPKITINEAGTISAMFDFGLITIRESFGNEIAINGLEHND